MVFDSFTGLIKSFLRRTRDGKTNFENLHVYKLSEKLADQLWKVVNHWELLSRDTVGRQLVRGRIVSGRILRKVVVEVPILSCVDSCEWLEGRFMKLDIGFDAHTGEVIDY